MGWKLGLERMRLLSSALGWPQRRFASVHVVGTNGKSSVTRMTAALLEAHGLAAGACLSPHLRRWSERVLIRGEEIAPRPFADSVWRTAAAAEAVDGRLEEGESVTQFEVATAAAFLALAGAGVEAGVIEAGLGGRLDATNVIPSRVTVLTSVGLDHTEWLGGTETEIAAEKLAVLRDRTALVIGSLGEEATEVALQTAGARGARVVRAAPDPGDDIRLAAAGRFQRRNFALAMAAAGALLGDIDRGLAAEVAAVLEIEGRLQRVADRPLTLIDAAHNPDGAAALAEALPDLAAGREVVACLAVLADKDAEAMAAALAPVLDRVVCAEVEEEALRVSGRPGARSRPAAELSEAFASRGVRSEAIPAARGALVRARSLACERDAVLLVAGSHYLLATARELIGDRHGG
ncbi:MAG: Mur ligase family protein [Solirubrobacterales bacterium]